MTPDEKLRELFPCLGDSWCMWHPDMPISHHPNCPHNFWPQARAFAKAMLEEAAQFAEDLIPQSNACCDSAEYAMKQIRALAAKLDGGDE